MGNSFIKRYAAEHKEPDQNYCPWFAIKWAGKNKKLGGYYKYYTPHNGKIYINEDPTVRNRWERLPGYNYSLSTRSYNYEGIYAKMISQNIMEIAYVIMEGNRGREGEVRKWSYARYYYSHRVFIDKKTHLPYDEKGERIWKNEDGKYYNKELVKWISSLESHGRMRPHNIEKTIEKFAGVSQAPIGWNGSMIELSYMWAFARYLVIAKERKVSDFAKTLKAYDLPERKYENSTCEFAILDDSYAVFRMFKTEQKYDYESGKSVNVGEAFEKCRVFISSKGKPTILEHKVNDIWELVGKDLRSVFYTTETETVGFDNIINWKPLKYIYDMVNESLVDPKATYSYGNEKSTQIVRKCINTLRHPIVEKLYKMGYKHIANELIGGEVNKTLRDMFYMTKINEKQKNVYKMLGVNKYLLAALESQEEYNKQQTEYRLKKHASVKDVKEIFGRDDVSDLSKETVEMYFNGVAELGSMNWRTILNKPYHYYWYYNEDNKYEDSPIEQERKLLEKLFRLEKTEPGITRAFSDAKHIYGRLANKPEINWSDFRHMDDVIAIHNNLQALMDIQEAEYIARRDAAERERIEGLKKVFEKLQEDRIEKFESHGEKYSIVVPHDLTEITTEGSSLHHCVGGYLDRHANGGTNILFLRNNENPTTPFYTIEVNNDGYVVQIHGKNNRWLGNDPDAIPFVWNWIQDRGFKCEKYKLLNQGAGYSQGHEQLDEKYLVA